jgi:hypothetical protein
MIKMQRTQKLPIFSVLAMMIYPKTVFLRTDLCAETSSSSCYSQLPTVSEPNADTDIVDVHTIS